MNIKPVLKVVFLFVLLLGSSGLMSSEVYYIAPSPSYPCPTEPCLTLSQFANNSNTYLNTNTTLIFLLGNHTLEVKLFVANISILYILSDSMSSLITCNHHAMFKFNNIGEVHMRGLTFIGCSGNVVKCVDQFMLQDSSLIGQNKNKGTALDLVESNATFVRSFFTFNKANKLHNNVTCSHYKTNTQVTTGGAIISTKCNVTIIECVFEENSARVGGAIFSEVYTNITIINSSFDGNNATGCTVGGGVLHAESGTTVMIYGSHFINNRAQYGGGGVLASRDVAHINITHSQFFGGDGGVVYVYDSVNITVTHSEFVNTNEYGYGVIYVHGVYGLHSHGGSVNITHSKFISNIAATGGGVVSTNYATITIAHSEFINNSAFMFGGGVLCTIGSDTIITNSNFINNTAQGEGGVMYAQALDSNVLSIANSQFINNTALTTGGVIAGNDDTRVIIIQSKFINNSAKQDGGVLYKMYSVKISYCDFINNSALGDGGVLLADFSFGESNSHVEITGSKFLNNSAKHNGGAISINQGVLIISNSSFDRNLVSNDGGVLYSDQTDVRISRAMFMSNRADGNGGIMHSGKGTVVVRNSKFLNNSAGYNGGVVSAQTKSMSIYESMFGSNSANLNGGVFSLYQGSTTVHGCNYDRNSAGNNGGIIQVYQGTLEFLESTFYGNTVVNDGGVILAYQTNTSVSACNFQSNMAMNDGGAVNAYQGSLSISEDCSFLYSIAHNDGGAIHAYEADLLIIGNTYISNKAGNRGGVWFVYQGRLTVTQSILSHSEATDGGVMYADQGNITAENISCIRNKAIEGGVLNIDHSTAEIRHSAFSHNSASGNGGAWFMEDSSMFLRGISSTGNTANFGGIVYSSKSKLYNFDSLFLHNSASIGIIYLLGSTVLFDGKTKFSINSGSCLVFNSNITFKGNTSFINCSQPIANDTTEIQEGGALTILKSNVIIEGIITLLYNHAENGGAIHATESKIYVYGESTIANNTATRTGGGIYLDMSDLNFQGNKSLTLSANLATEKGGGVHAISSTINMIDNHNTDSNIINSTTYSGSRLYFIENVAEKGGGLCLEMNAKLYILKSMPYSEPFNIVNFIANSADYGGAVYVSDDSNLGLCDLNYRFHFKAKECFFQTLAIYSSLPSNISQQTTNMKNILFLENSAHTSGSSLFGGLIDRCKVHHFTEHKKFLQTNYKPSSHLQQHQDYRDSLVNGVDYIRNISNIGLSDIGSLPVQLCFCKYDKPNCDYEPDPIRVVKGKRFSVELVAVDQVNHPVNATIYSSLYKTGGGFMKGQSIQNTTKTCTKLNFNLFSPSDKEELIMYAEGPCMYSPQSQRRLNIEFTACNSCPIGFEKHVEETTVCDCICDSKLEPYITKCNASTEQVERDGNFWITYVTSSDNATSGYLIYPHCPLNYCLPPTLKVEINLNIPYGDDTQCASGRSGTLCGTCQSNLSLSLGSSHCIPCSSQWPLVLVAILMAAFIVGMVLVALLLVLNLTVAVGTLNGVIFYANIVAANGSVFLPFSAPNFVSVFISWLNLELGLDTCFFPGMDAYWKTLLQLAFPMYVIFLVVMVIIISEHSTKFARLIAKKNPVATLATLILLSYTKFLNTVITSLSFAILSYPDGSYHVVWLPDATFPYLRGKHIVLFIIAVVILLIGTLYTALLFSWQWLLQHQDKMIFMWTKHQKLCHFIEPYHAPYTFEHRYWTGLLLLVRVLLYIISAINVTGDPRVALVSTIIVVGCLLALKGVLEKKIYSEWLVDTTEIVIYINIVVFATLTLYTFDGTNNQTAVAYTSIMITFTVLLVVITSHVTRNTSLRSVIRKTLTKLLAHKKKCLTKHVQAGTFSDEYNRPLITQSSIEIPKPCTKLESELKGKEITTGSIQVVVMDVENPPHLDDEVVNSSSSTEAGMLQLNN